MSSFEVPGIPDEILAALERRAAAHQRTLQMEVRLILEEAAREAPPDSPRPSIADELAMAEGPSGATPSWDRESIYGDDGR